MIRTRLFFAGLFFFFLLSGSFGQTDTPKEKSLKYFNKTEAGVSFGIGSFKTDVVDGQQKKIKNDELVINFQTINGIKYMNRLGLGLSLGFEKWRNGFFWPIYGVITFDLKPADNTFFADLYLGYSIGTRYATTFFEEGTGAFGLSVGVGYKMKVAGKISFMYEVFYRYQAINSSYFNIVNTTVDSVKVQIKTRYDYTVPLHFAGFKIGIIIP